MRAFLCGSDSLTGRSYGYRTDAQLKAELKQQGKPLPRYVEQEFEAYLQCGCAEIIEDRHARRSTLITSRLPIEHWHDYIGEATVADAILDRLLNGAHRLELIGDSMRRNIQNNTQEKTEKVD